MTSITTAITNFFLPENEDQTTIKEHISPSGKYKLVVSKFKTKKGCWNYSQGKVYVVGQEEPITIVQRNYSSFPFLFIEDHSNGHDYLICGENYQGQTVIELDTGKRTDNLSNGAKSGFGFCWVEYKYHKPSNMLIVCGCIWACPYEYRFFDFSDPMSGWPYLESESCIDEDQRWPEFQSDGTIKCFQSEYIEDEDDSDDEDSENKKLPPIAATQTFKRENNEFVLIEEWVSEKEQLKREENEKARKKYEAWLKNFKTNDPMYLTLNACSNKKPFDSKAYDSIGFTYHNWCPHWSGSEKRMCRRIISKKTGGQSVDIEWGVDTGPIKLTIFDKSGNNPESKWFEHSSKGIREACKYAQHVVLNQSIWQKVWSFCKERVSS